MDNIKRLRKEYIRLKELSICQDNNVDEVKNEIINTVGELLTNELYECNCDGINEGCSSLLCKSRNLNNNDNVIIMDDSFYIEIPKLDFLKSYMISSISYFNDNLYLELYEFSKNDFILPFEIEKLIENEVIFDISIKKSNCNYTEILKNVKLKKFNRTELRRSTIGCIGNPYILYVEGIIEKKEYVKNETTDKK